MATRKKSSGRKKSARAGKRGAKRSGMKKGGARKASRKAGGAKRSAKRSAPKRSSARRSSKKRTGGGSSPMARVKRVTREVVQQATAAVTAGVETVRDVGENLVDRVRTELAPKPEQ
jgi:hypothetical protein